ncbi:alpha,alpha-trehalase [Aestuariibaculum sp. M13]|uniref:alpha,alpha-trehalase n=1 Tax=Aestuariibaculum sp. M13 TaxID=2967132 RepID=UPI002159D290|nr:alpha,alpha-trehalase [Aestuariibaculum sp. M13]MCR8668716.1 alpha,alpha-trehalase [Aestuariibaculum sp. M13]
MNKNITFLILFTIYMPLMAQNEKGNYFAKKTYDNKAIPTFAESKKLLPEPILEGHPGWVDMYWKTWEIAFSNFKKPPHGSPFVSNFIDEAFNELIFQWDTHFMIMFARYGHTIFPAIESHDNFYSRQHEDGLIWRVIAEADGSDHPWGGGEKFCRAINPPIFSWVEMKNYELTGDKSRFEMILPVLEKYVEWLEKHRLSQDTPHKLYWSNGQASGMDNTPRDKGRPGEHSSFSPVGWVDISCQMVMNYNDLSNICKILGHKKKAQQYRQKAKKLGKRINEWCWNEEDGIYYDVDTEGKQQKVKTIASFWPMLAGITTPKKDKRLIQHLKNPKEFWRKNIFPSLAADEEGYSPRGHYWKGGTWAPTNYMVIKGLEKTNNEKFATECAEKYLYGLYNVYEETGTLWECYAPDAFAPSTIENNKKLARKDFVGWTGIGPVALLIENVLGIRINGKAHKIDWIINRKSKHGIKNIHCGKATVSLLYELKNGKEIIAATTNYDIKLKIIKDKRSKEYTISKGKNIIEL